MSHPECKQLLFPLPSSAFTASLGPEPQDQTPQGKRAWFRYPRALLLTTATGHAPGCPQEASLGADPEAGLPSAALRTFCHPGLGGGIFASLGCPSSFSETSLGKASCWEFWCDLRVFDPFLLPCSSKVFKGSKFLWSPPCHNHMQNIFLS